MEGGALYTYAVAESQVMLSNGVARFYAIQFKIHVNHQGVSYSPAPHKFLYYKGLDISVN